MARTPSPRRMALGVVARAVALFGVLLGVFVASPSAAGPFAYIANSIDGTVSVVDTSNSAVIATIPIGGNPYGTAVNTAGTRVYVADPATGVVKVIDVATNAVIATIPVTGAFGVAVSPTGTRVYATMFGSAQVAVIDAATNAVIGAPISVGQNPGGLVVNPANTRVFVVGSASGRVDVIDTATATVVATIAVSGTPRQIALSADGNRAYVSECEGNRVVAIDTVANTVAGSVGVGSCPDGIAINHSGTRVYAANNNSGSVSVIDTAADTVVATITVGSSPHGVSVTPDDQRVYVANYSSATVSVIAASTNTVLQAVAVGGGPHSFGTFISVGPPPPTTLSVGPTAPASIYPGDTFNTVLNIQHTVSLYAAQAECHVDPAIAAPSGAVFGGLFDSVYRLVAANHADPLTGTWVGAISQQRPAGPISGDGALATLGFIALLPGTRVIACVPMLADRNGLPLPVDTTSTTVTVLPFARLDGIAKYQGRSTHGAIEITASGPVTKDGLTNAQGQFALEGLKAGTYQARADAPGYLPACHSAVSLAIGESRTLEPTQILGGDANDDASINIADATLIGANFGGTPPAADDRADINKDGIVDVRDLAILAGNYGLDGCQPWGGGE